MSSFKACWNCKNFLCKWVGQENFNATCAIGHWYMYDYKMAKEHFVEIMHIAMRCKFYTQENQHVGKARRISPKVKKEK